MKPAQLSITLGSTSFLLTNSNVVKMANKGLSYITSDLKINSPLNEYHLEMMIYRSEELLENDLKLRPVHGDVFVKENNLTKNMSDSYFNGARSVTSEHIEKTFNIIAEASSYGPLLMDANQLRLLALLVFIREATHHLDISTIRFF